MSAFFDSNILIYAYSTDVRRDRALAAIADGGIISAQVLNEFTNVLRKKQKQDWPVIEAALDRVAQRREQRELSPVRIHLPMRVLRPAGPR